MGRTLPANVEFETDLSRLGSAESIAALRHGIEAALAVAPGETLNATDYPILGHYFTSTADQFLAYFVTPGRFIRYEVAAGRSLTVTVTLDRVSRVVEEAGASELIVTVEMDADVTTTVLEAQSERVDEAAASGMIRGLARNSRTVYLMRADEVSEIMRLASFSRALRSAIGL